MANVQIIVDAVDNASGVLNPLAVFLGNELTQAFDAVTGAIGDFFKASLAAEQQQAQLGALLKSTGDASGLTAGMVNDLAKQFRDLAGGSDEAIVNIEEIGIRSGAINAAQMPEFIKNVADLGAVMGDTSAAATLLARAQEDPVAALGKLQRAGILFDESTKEQIKTLVKHGETAQATALIMQRVAEATGGAAAANASTLAGRWEILTNHLEDAGKGIAEKLLPPIETLFDKIIAPNIPLIDDLASAFGNFIGALLSGQSVTSNYLPQLQAALNAIFGPQTSGMIANAITGLMTFFAQARDSAPGFIAQLQGVWQVLTSVWAWINTTLIPTLTTLNGWLQAYIPAALQVLSAYWTQVLQPAIAQVWAWIQSNLFPLFGQLIVWLQTNVPLATQAMVTAFQNALSWTTTNWPIIQATIQTAITNVDSIVRTVLGALQKFWQDNGDNILVILNANWTAIKLTATVAGAALYAIIQVALSLIQGFWKTWGDTIIKILGDMYDALKGALQLFADIFRGNWSKLGSDILTIFQANMQAASDFFSKIAQIIIGNIQGVLNFIAQLVGAIRSIPPIPGAPGGSPGGAPPGGYGNYAPSGGGAIYGPTYNVTVNTSTPFDANSQLQMLRGFV